MLPILPQAGTAHLSLQLLLDLLPFIPFLSSLQKTSFLASPPQACRFLTLPSHCLSIPSFSCVYKSDSVTSCKSHFYNTSSRQPEGKHALLLHACCVQHQPDLLSCEAEGAGVLSPCSTGWWIQLLSIRVKRRLCVSY